ncbi:hypothetical protein H112_04461 [Trichophyton rubrum D6]|uniref:Uncharacterized protein n=5 Tax=Trichophyton TaxID=5550 RepID=A0A178F3R8_TRIRU|nr:uncharacterized protein TERG_04233 [Trichophyton rubrum CBS 118892]EZF22987.1 hypothetical protein H100_04470 [Trichophyton rubrum MR850]EZF41812.1 hypothetical protein H102_04453 [Trichophyton rubrum CBS 100081]EZF52460.1 hypothetical protein H103_04465 [Trichophyton rubrum CBS 288.86]EZF63089.1 hypothetical protein H104_04453 [Trichophyton rubrum CBS 289.86]EZF73672.1 hypothetical protein H105_04478 [Trichophyton soudanense CBS 452.61]EZF84395.1 hypothetical protein H110_04456 [Trichophy
MPLFASLFSRRRSRQTREKEAASASAGNDAAEASAGQKNGTNHKAPRVELDFPHINPSSATSQPAAENEPRTPARGDDDKSVNPASVELPVSPQNEQPGSPGIMVSKKQSLMSVRSDGQQPQPQFFKEGKRRARRMSVFSSLRSRPSTAMSTATEPAPELQMSPVTSHVNRPYFPPDPRFQLDLKPDVFGKAFTGSSLPFVEEMFGNNGGENNNSAGSPSQQKSDTSTTAATTTTSSLDPGNNVSRGWLLPDLQSVMDGDTLNTNHTNATLNQSSCSADNDGTANQATPHANSEKIEKTSSESLPSPSSLPPLPASPEPGSPKSSSRNSLKRLLSKRISLETQQGSTPADTDSAAPNGVTA